MPYSDCETHADLMEKNKLHSEHGKCITELRNGSRAGTGAQHKNFVCL